MLLLCFLCVNRKSFFEMLKWLRTFKASWKKRLGLFSVRLGQGVIFAHGPYLGIEIWQKQDICCSGSAPWELLKKYTN